MKKLTWWGCLLGCMLLTGCGGGGGNSHPALPGSAATTPATNGVIRVGDKITVQLSSVPDGGYFHEFQVPESGDIDVPFLTQTIHAAGLSESELGKVIETAYRAEKIYTSPQVQVQAEERYMIVGGDVRSPSNVVWRPDSTLMSTVISCGGFTEYADRRHVRILRGQQTLVYDCNAAIQTPGADPPVYPGDQIFVPRTMF